jgi:hypothetical protein
MDGGKRASRRSILRLAALAMGGLAGAIGLVAAEERAQGVARPVGGSLGRVTTFELQGMDWRVRSPALRPGELPRRGDSVTLSGSLARVAGREPIGAFFGTSAHLDTPGHGPFAQTEMQFHSFALPEGNLFGMGAASRGGQGQFAITGGTGRFAGATGSYTAAQNPVEVGGDGTARFQMTIKLAGEEGSHGV